MPAIFAAVVSLLETLLPSLGSGTVIASIIGVLVQLIPALTSEAESLVQPIKNIIAALSANPATTAQQLATLQSLDAQVDAAFESAATAAGAPPAPTS